MEESNQILKEQIEKLPKTLKKFVLDNKWTEELYKYLQKFKLDEWQNTIIENEVLLILMGMEDYTNLTKNISEQTELENETAEQVSEFVIKNILEPVATEVVEEQEKEGDNIKPNNIGNSFEQIILNQAIAMQPARDASLDLANMAGGPAIEVGGQTQTHSQVPENLPVKDVVSETPQKPTESDSEVRGLSYSNQDPYREPIE